MKIRNLAIIFSLGLFAASCTDKAAQEEITKMKADMAAADSLCQADKAMLMDSIAKIQMMMDSIMNPPNRTSSGTSKASTGGSTGGTNTTTTDKSVNDRGGNMNVVDKNVNERGGDDGKTVKKDINKRGGN